MPWIALLAALAAQDPPDVDVTAFDLEDLLAVRVTSVSRREQSLSAAPAAVHVVPGDAIRRTGATSIAEALRGVPGVEVGRSKSSIWAVSARGFNDNLSNKLLVLVDGRSVYSPLHSGVFWDVQDTFLEDVDRIEIVRGPGGSLWGANAINGVVNVITKPAEETRGGLLYFGGGTEERGFAAARVGFKVDDETSARVYAKGFTRDDAADGLVPENEDHDRWKQVRAGFRADRRGKDGSRLTLGGDFYDGEEMDRVVRWTLPQNPGDPVADVYNDRTEVQGGHLLARWESPLGADSGLSVQLYYDYTNRLHSIYQDVIHTADLDAQHRFRLMDGHDVTWGVGYRVLRIDFDGSFSFEIDPEKRTDDVVSAFVQDEIALLPDALHLTLGSKFEHNDYSGFEAQPSVRLAWTPHERHTVWASVTRAVRTPSLIDVDGRLVAAVAPTAPPTVIAIVGDDDFESEELLAYEAGWRFRPADPLTVDLALFANRYDHLRSGVVGAPFVETDPPPPHLVFPVNLENGLDAKSWGAELALNLQAAEGWLLQASYTHLRLNPSEEPAEGRDPADQAWIRSAMDLPADFGLDVVARWVSRLPAFDIDGYVEMDVRLSWRDVARGLEFAIVGRNLLHASHPEFQSAAQRSEMQRGVYVSLSMTF